MSLPLAEERVGWGVIEGNGSGPPLGPLPYPETAPSRTVPRREKSNCVFVALPGADAHRAFDGNDEDLAVADAAGLGRGADRFDHAFG